MVIKGAPVRCWRRFLRALFLFEWDTWRYWRSSDMLMYMYIYVYRRLKWENSGYICRIQTESCGVLSYQPMKLSFRDCWSIYKVYRYIYIIYIFYVIIFFSFTICGLSFCYCRIGDTIIMTGCRYSYKQKKYTVGFIVSILIVIKWIKYIWIL